MWTKQNKTKKRKQIIMGVRVRGRVCVWRVFEKWIPLVPNVHQLNVGIQSFHSNTSPSHSIHVLLHNVLPSCHSLGRKSVWDILRLHIFTHHIQKHGTFRYLKDNQNEEKRNEENSQRIYLFARSLYLSASILAITTSGSALKAVASFS